MSDAVTLVSPFAGWLAPLDEVPDAVFAERMMGDGFAVDPVEGVLRAPATGEVISIPASAHAVTLRLDNVLGWEAAAGKGQQVSLRRA